MYFTLFVFNWFMKMMSILLVHIINIWWYTKKEWKKIFSLTGYFMNNLWSLWWEWLYDVLWCIVMYCVRYDKKVSYFVVHTFFKISNVFCKVSFHFQDFFYIYIQKEKKKIQQKLKYPLSILYSLISFIYITIMQLLIIKIFANLFSQHKLKISHQGIK